jgi:hypothetical protein
MTPPALARAAREPARARGIARGYRANSVARDSRTTVTRIWPG